MLKDLYKHLRNTQCFVKYKDKVSEYNADALGLFIVFGIIISITAILLELFMLRTADFWSTFVMLAYFLLLYFLYRKYIHTYVDYATLFLYLAQIPIVILLIFMGTYINSGVKAFTIMIAMISFPAFILDRPRNVLIYTLSIALVFAFFDIQVKSGVLLLHDLLHTIITCLMALFTSAYVLDTRIENVEKSQMFLTDSEHDPLTGIYNRRGGEEKIKECIEEGIGGTFLILDIDDFKHVNDTYGHTMGDEILSAVSMTLASSFRSSDVVMRMGGDEFVVYAPGLVNYFFIDGKLQQINEKMREITCAAGKDNITVGMGAVINDGNYPDYDSLFNEADSLLYEVKNSGKNGFRLQDRPYSEVKDKSTSENVAKIRAERDAANDAEEAKYKD